MIEQMADSCHRRVEEHSRPRPLHHDSYLLPHLRLIAVGCTVFTGRLAGTISAMVQTCAGIFSELPIFIRHFPHAQFVPAVQSNHESDGLFVFLYFSHVRAIF